METLGLRSGIANARTAGGVVGYLFLSDVVYCSCTGGTTVKGSINAGGIVGIAYTTVNNCFSADCTISAILRKGGVIGNSPETSNISFCWDTYDSSKLPLLGRKGGGTAYDKDSCLEGVFDPSNWATRIMIQLTGITIPSLHLKKLALPRLPHTPFSTARPTTNYIGRRNCGAPSERNILCSKS